MIESHQKARFFAAKLSSLKPLLPITNKYFLIMSGLALAIVVVAAFFHASWNLLAKKSKNKMAFIGWFLLIATIGYWPIFLYYWPGTTVSPTGWICIVATGILHALYFWFMGGAYERGDLSLFYPLSRGS